MKLWIQRKIIKLLGLEYLINEHSVKMLDKQKRLHKYAHTNIKRTLSRQSTILNRCRDDMSEAKDLVLKKAHEIEIIKDEIHAMVDISMNNEHSYSWGVTAIRQRDGSCHIKFYDLTHTPLDELKSRFHGLNAQYDAPKQIMKFFT